MIGIVLLAVALVLFAIDAWWHKSLTAAGLAALTLAWLIGAWH